jgi:hypothetical protein
MKNRKREWNQLRKFLEENKWAKYKLNYYNFQKTVIVFPKDDKWGDDIVKCYPMEKKEISFESFTKNYSSYYGRYDLEECGFWDVLVNLVRKYYDNDDKLLIYLPEKVNPLIITTKESNFKFGIAPRIDDEQDALMNTVSGWKEVTGCKCPAIIRDKIKRGELRPDIEAV